MIKIKSPNKFNSEKCFNTFVNDLKDYIPCDIGIYEDFSEQDREIINKYNNSDVEVIVAFDVGVIIKVLKGYININREINNFVFFNIV